jgi:hypothetical protein
MLAAYDCFGDSDLLNLQYLKRLLGRTIKAHKDIVREGHSLLDVPFQDVVYYACEHAEVTLQLARLLQQELARRNVEDQYKCHAADGQEAGRLGVCRNSRRSR